MPPVPVAAGVRRPAGRLPHRQGVVQWPEVFRLLGEKGFDGHLSDEAPNPALWSRSPYDVAREQATRALIARAL
jgi:sugar phosphate isomerase/epimerase